MRATIKGKAYHISKENVEKKLSGIQPEEDERAKYFAEIGGKRFSIKQALSQTINLPKLGFTSQDAFTILQRLGFEITKRNNGS